MSGVMQFVTHCLGIKQCLIPFFHPAANPEERRNRDIKTQLAIYAAQDHSNWPDGLLALRFAMNTAKHLATMYSPAYLSFGKELRTPYDTEWDFRQIIDNENFIPEITPYLRNLTKILQNAHLMVEKSQDRSKHYADQRRRQPPDYAIGDQVLITSHILSQAEKGITSKFAPKRDEPYTIIKQKSPTSFEIASADNIGKSLGTYHVSALQHFHMNPDEVAKPTNPIRKRGRPPKQSK